MRTAPGVVPMTHQRPPPDARIVELVRILKEANHELQQLTGGPLDAGSDGGYLLREAQQRLQTSEMALRASEQQFSNAFQFAPIGVSLVSLDGRFIAVNQALCRMLRYSAAELLERSSPEITHPADLAADLANVQRVLDGVTNAYQMRKRYLRKDAELVWVLLSVSLVRSDAGEPVHFISQVQDLSEQRQAEAAAARLAAIVESSDDAILGRDLDGTITSWNRGAEKIYGYTAAEMVGQSIQPLIPVGAIDEEDVLFGQIRQGHVVDHLDTQRVTRDGRLIDVSITLSPIQDALGNVIGVSKIARDITGAKRAQAQLVTSESRFRRLVESNAQGILIWEASGTIVEANDALLALIGYSREDLVQRRLNMSALTPPEYTTVDVRAMSELAATGVCTPYEKEFLRRGGSRVPVLVGAAAFEDGPDKGVAFVVDLTERKKLEKQFLRAQRMESIGTLAGGIAHDLNNVLAPILMGIELLKENNPSRDALEMLATLETSAKRGADLVKQVLSFGRGVEGEHVHVTLAHLMRDLLKVMRDTFPKSIDVHMESASPLWVVSGDPTQLHQVFMNLCVNARDAMPRGGRLHLTMENVVLDDTYCALNSDAHPGPYVVIQVVDTGTGIPPEIRDKVFEPFYTTKEVGKGTGLGLSTTIAIVKSHGGFINLYSEMGRGTKFKVYLPANTTAEAAEDVAIAQTGLPRGRGELVLVVDDENGVREIAQRTLERYGYRVVLAANGAEAVAVYARQQADVAVVLTDMAMPIMDGPALIVALRSIDPGVTIIGSSGLASNSGIARAVGAGVAQFVPKPYTARVLLTTLRKAIDDAPPE